MRTCSSCRETKVLTEFHRNQKYCKPCAYAYLKQWRKAQAVKRWASK